MQSTQSTTHRVRSPRWLLFGQADANAESLRLPPGGKQPTVRPMPMLTIRFRPGFASHPPRGQDGPGTLWSHRPSHAPHIPPPMCLECAPHTACRLRIGQCTHLRCGVMEMQASRTLLCRHRQTPLHLWHQGSCQPQARLLSPAVPLAATETPIRRERRALDPDTHGR